MLDLNVAVKKKKAQGAPLKGSAPFSYQEGVSFNTTGQVRQNPSATMGKRARRRAISFALSDGLEKVSSHGGMKKAYRRTREECCQVIKQEDGTLKTKYCRGRWCAVCGAIRQSILIEKYKPVLQEWDECWFLTLTIRNVSSYKLRSAIQGMVVSFRNCVKQARRKTGRRLKAVRSLEVSFSEEEGTFHPHFHVVVGDYESAKVIISHWVKTRDDASHSGQDLRKADDGSVMELFKYSVKLATTKKGKDGRLGVVPIRQLDEVFSALYRVRTIQPYGVQFEEVTDEEMEEKGEVEAFRSPDDDLFWDYFPSVRDWVDVQTGEVLAGVELSERMESFVRKLEGQSIG